MSKRDDYQHHMEEELALWSARFEALRTHAGKDADPALAAEFERWQAAEQVAAAKLATLKNTEGDAWDDVKQELEQAWHAIAGVLDQGTPRARPRLLTEEEIRSLTPEQRDAILEAMVIAVVVDGKVGEGEVARFDREVASVPWVQPKEEILLKARAALARVAALANDDERRAMLESIGARLPAGPIAEKTLAMMALVMTADGAANAAEQNSLAAFAQAFGISPERLRVVAASVREATAPASVPAASGETSGATA
jgi:uncharacterized tellurite resistance protein B-like protein